MTIHQTRRNRRKRPYHPSGQHVVTKALPFLSARVTDATVPADSLSPVERGARDLRHDMMVDLGGPEAVSAAQRALLDATVGSVIVLQSIDTYLFTLASAGGLVNKRSRRAFAIVADRMRVADSLARQLGTLGLERRAREVPTLQTYLATQYSPDAPRASSTGAGAPSPTTEETERRDVAPVRAEMRDLGPHRQRAAPEAHKTEPPNE